MRTAHEQKPQPADFDDYRVYLRALVAWLKVYRRGFSFRQFAKKAGYQTPNFLKLVIEGQRNLVLASVEKFARGLGLTEAEREALEDLLRFSHASSDAEKNRYYARLCRRRSTHTTELSAVQYELYSLWYALPIRELLLLPDFEESPVWIAKRLYPRISAKEARQALALLQRVGLVVRDEHGRLQPATMHLTTGSQVPLGVRNYHRSMLQHSAESLDQLPVSHRNVSSLTLRLSRSQYENYCSQLARLREELLAASEVQPCDQATSEVYHLGFQIVPLTLSGGIS